jgi:hypothetical protein
MYIRTFYVHSQKFVETKLWDLRKKKSCHMKSYFGSPKIIFFPRPIKNVTISLPNLLCEECQDVHPEKKSEFLDNLKYTF